MRSSTKGGTFYLDESSSCLLRPGVGDLDESARVVDRYVVIFRAVLCEYRCGVQIRSVQLVVEGGQGARQDLLVLCRSLQGTDQ